MIKKSLAFTLAESLLVMGVIGIVATLVVPNLKNNTDDQVYVAKARKVYAELETAYGRAELKYGNPRDWSKAQTEEHLREFLNVKKVCAEGTCSKQFVGCKYDYTILKDDAIFCITVKGDDYSPLAIDLDGVTKGYNTNGKDIFPAYISYGDGITSQSKITPYIPGISMEEGETPVVANYLQWVLQYGNLDYLKCDVEWETKTTCK